jgi:hemerythrin superfamily protein
MSKLVQTLKAEHRNIEQLLQEVRDAGITTDAGQRSLNKAKQLLLDHLRKEDEMLYPELERMDATRDTARAFYSEMSQVSKKIVAFFEKYEGVSEGLDFARDFGHILGILGGRIRREESTLYPKYDALAETAHSRTVY